MSEKKAGVLQERLETTRSSLEQQEELVRSLRQELSGLRVELDSYQEQRAQDLESIEQVPWHRTISHMNTCGHNTASSC